MLSVIEKSNTGDLYTYRVIYGVIKITVNYNKITNVEVLDNRTLEKFDNPYHENRVLQFLPKWANKMGFEISPEIKS